MLTRLIRKGWLYRSIEVNLPDGPHVVEYNGRGLGYEKVVIDGYSIPPILGSVVRASV
jgi:hypothetical protein